MSIDIKVLRELFLSAAEERAEEERRNTEWTTTARCAALEACMLAGLELIGAAEQNAALKADNKRLRAALSGIAEGETRLQCLVAHLGEMTLECDATRPCLACQANVVVNRLRARCEEQHKLIRDKLLDESGTKIWCLECGSVWRKGGTEEHIANCLAAPEVKP